jgi:hypothetical protein
LEYEPSRPGIAGAEDAVDKILNLLPAGAEIGQIEIWGHCDSDGQPQIGSDTITKDNLTNASPLAKLKPFLTPNSIIYFRSCFSFHGPSGKDLAQTAANFFNCTVWGHTDFIPDGWGNFGAPGWTPVWPTYPHVELKPGQVPNW